MGVIQTPKILAAEERSEAAIGRAAAVESGSSVLQTHRVLRVYGRFAASLRSSAATGGYGPFHSLLALNVSSPLGHLAALAVTALRVLLRPSLSCSWAAKISITV